MSVRANDFRSVRAKKSVFGQAVRVCRVLAVLACAGTAHAQSIGTIFTYQGQLSVAGNPASNATADILVRIFGVPSGGTQIGSALLFSGVALDGQGRFALNVDLGSASNASGARWLEIEVRSPSGVGPFVALGRQRVQPTPSAMFASLASNADQLGGLPPAFYRDASNLNAGTISDARLPATAVRTNAAQTITGATSFTSAGNTFVGNGAGLSGLSATSVATGTLSDARLSSNVALRNGGNQFSGPQTFSGGFVGIGRDFVVGSEQFGLGANNPGYNGMYVQNSNSAGLPFYGYSLPGAVAWTYLTQQPGGASLWQLFHGGDRVRVQDNGQITLFTGGVDDVTMTSSANETTAVIENTQIEPAFGNRVGRSWALRSVGDAGGGFSNPVSGALRIVDDTFGANSTRMVITPSGMVGINRDPGPNVGSANGALWVQDVGALGLDVSCDDSFGETARFVNTGFRNGWAVIADAIPGAGQTATAIWGRAPAPGFAGFFQGNVQVNGTISATSKSFRIDHPQDPANKELWHTSIESDAYLNIYSGNATTDAQGYATISLPAWMQAANTNFRYQLTVIDEGETQAEFVLVRVVRKVSDGSFTIKTSAPNVEVSWQLTGERSDAWARANPPRPERMKRAEDRGRYIHPEAFGLPQDRAMDNAPPSVTSGATASPDQTAAKQPSLTAPR